MAPAAARAEQEAAGRRTTVWALGGAGAVVLAILVVVILAARPPGFSASKTMKTFEGTSTFASFSYPADWSANAYGKSGAMTMGISCGKGKFVRFDLDANLAASIMAETAATPIAPQAPMLDEEGPAAAETMPVVPQKDPMIKAHEFLASKHQQANRSWEEGDTSLVRIGGQRAAVSEFTARKRALFSKVRIKGLRYSVKCGEYTIEILAYCPEKEWSRYQPTVAEMVSGLRWNCQQ